MITLAAALVDINALWKIVALSVIAGAGVVGAFGYVVLGVSRYQRVQSGQQRARYLLLIGLAGGCCLAALVLGLVGLAHK